MPAICTILKLAIVATWFCANAVCNGNFILLLSTICGGKNCVPTFGRKEVIIGCIKPLIAHNKTGMEIIKLVVRCHL
ncbi:MAG: hypothetical protein EAZ35_10175 [Sphingobacteriia bacterium]|nr:MAG: hypothetical protein EAZ35_10175 [Sphingobacteriia bacterium]